MSRISYSWTTSLATLSDGFCGAGGSSYGAERAGAIVQLAMNHNAKSLLTHEANFPLAQHRIEDIADLDPSDPPHPLMAWWSPECRFHSLSRGKKINEYGSGMEVGPNKGRTGKAVSDNLCRKCCGSSLLEGISTVAGEDAQPGIRV